MYSLFNHRLVFGEACSLNTPEKQQFFVAQAPGQPLVGHARMCDTPQGKDEPRTETLERTLKIRVAAADPLEAEFIDRVLQAWKRESESVLARCDELNRQGWSALQIFQEIRDTHNFGFTGALERHRDKYRSQLPAPGIRAVREGAFLDWMEGLDYGTKRHDAKNALSAALQVPALSPQEKARTHLEQRERSKRAQFRVAPSTQAVIAPDNSEISLIINEDTSDCLDSTAQSDSIALRFHVFSMGRKSIRRLMRDASGRRSSVKHLSIAFVNDPVSSDPANPKIGMTLRSNPQEYFFYLCYDGCEKRKQLETQTRNEESDGIGIEQCDALQP
jgi:hypothetical protein